MVIWIYICIYLPICIHVKMYRTILQEVKITVILENNFKNKDINISKLTYKRDTENAVFVSYSYCNKLPQVGWIKTTEIYCLIVLEERSLKSRVMLHLKLVRKSFLPLPSFWWFARSLAFLDIQLHNSSLFVTWHSSYVSVFSHDHFRRTAVILG